MLDVTDWIAGRGRPGTATTGGGTAPLHDPATGAVTGRVELGSAAEVDSAVGTAREVFQTWGRSSLGKRVLGGCPGEPLPA
jgi:malonate-semialdehyde dehydrogenase (acetylating)/methylmalonate-semialdehyde dehydrogenase